MLSEEARIILSDIAEGNGGIFYKTLKNLFFTQCFCLIDQDRANKSTLAHVFAEANLRFIGLTLPTSVEKELQDFFAQTLIRQNKVMEDFLKLADSYGAAVVYQHHLASEIKRINDKILLVSNIDDVILSRVQKKIDANQKFFNKESSAKKYWKKDQTEDAAIKNTFFFIFVG